MSSKYFNSAVDDPYDKYAHTGKRQANFARDLKFFLKNADTMSDRYRIEEKVNNEGDCFYKVSFLDKRGAIKTSAFIGIEKSPVMDVSIIVIDMIQPDVPVDNLLYFVDARLLFSDMARKHEVHCTNSSKGHFEMQGVKFFSDIEDKFRDFMSDVETAIRREPASLNNHSRLRPQPRIPMHKGFY